MSDAAEPTVSPAGAGDVAGTGGCWQAFRDLVAASAVVCFTVAGDPVSKARPRFGLAADEDDLAGGGMGVKVRTYTPKTTTAAETAVAAAFTVAYPRWRPDPAGTYGVLLEFHAATFRRRDIDNLTKLVLDAGNEVIWVDDAQVVEVHTRLERGSADPRTDVLVYPAAAGPRAKTRRPARRRRPGRNVVVDVADVEVFKRRVFRHIVTSVMAGRHPTPDDIAAAVDVGGPEVAEAIVEQLEDAGCLTRAGRPPRYKILAPLKPV